METKEALDILKRHNIWRRGADIEPTNPERLGKAIDKAIEVLGSDVVGRSKQFYCNDEKHYPEIGRCKNECDMCKQERLKQ